MLFLPSQVTSPDEIAQQTQHGAKENLRRLAFQVRLQALTNKIHATQQVDEIMLHLSADVCELFDADRITLYKVSEDKKALESKVKTGLLEFRDIRLPIADQSIAGFVALTGRTLNITDVYDNDELAKINPQLKFLREVDQRTGYRTQQMLLAPITDAKTNTCLGVVQLINHRQQQRFDELAVDGMHQLTQTLAIAFQQRIQPKRVLRNRYDGLVVAGDMSPVALAQAMHEAREQRVDVETVLMQAHGVSRAAIGRSLSRFFDVPYEPFRPGLVRPTQLLRRLKKDFVLAEKWLPIEDGEHGLVIMCLDPEHVRSAMVVNHIFPHCKPIYKVTTVTEFVQTAERFFTESDSGFMGLDEGVGEGDEPPLDDVSAAADNEVVKLVNKIILDAYQQGASDIHIEPYPGKAKTEIRLRKDGTLVPYMEVPGSYRNALVARIKIMCDLDISEKRKPQDGKIRFKKFGPADIELRVATVPSSGGMEDVVMRILAGGEPLPLNKLGLSVSNLDRLLGAISKPYGLFFVCGPTGSGKTTTLHSVLGYLNTPETKIWTAEDPVEITQKGLRQVQVNRKAGMDFATVMKAFLRADPDIIMVGEMRDAETTRTGIEASLTGHLVFATLHTNSAPESIIRLLDMGMDPFNFADALLGILAQRLAKRLCSACKQAYEPSTDEVESLLREYCAELQSTPDFQADPDAALQRVRQHLLASCGHAGRYTLYRKVGCDTCLGSGYKGRVGLHELLIASDRIKQQIQEHARVPQLLSSSLAEGMRTLKMDGIEKVLKGITDLPQVHAVCIK
jgi:type II secretory ATPase GspE/PulE/Tfp pilus assembly ATPase PilB-like protein